MVSTWRGVVTHNRRGRGLTDLALQTLHRGRLSDVAHVHRDLGAPAEGFGVKQQDDGGFKLAADGRVHLGADQHHPLEQPMHMLDFTLVQR